jgi:hypothetical protein
VPGLRESYGSDRCSVLVLISIFKFLLFLWVFVTERDLIVASPFSHSINFQTNFICSEVMRGDASDSPHARNDGGGIGDRLNGSDQ